MVPELTPTEPNAPAPGLQPGRGTQHRPRWALPTGEPGEGEGSQAEDRVAQKGTRLWAQTRCRPLRRWEHTQETELGTQL